VWWHCVEVGCIVSVLEILAISFRTMWLPCVLYKYLQYMSTGHRGLFWFMGMWDGNKPLKGWSDLGEGGGESENLQTIPFSSLRTIQKSQTTPFLFPSFLSLSYSHFLPGCTLCAGFPRFPPPLEYQPFKGQFFFSHFPLAITWWIKQRSSTDTWIYTVNIDRGRWVVTLPQR